MAQDDLSLLQEIDESLQLENAEKFLRKHGIALIAACVVIVLATAVSVYWKNHVREKNSRETTIITSADGLIESDKYEDAIKKLNELSNPGHGTTAISRLMQAGAYLSSGHPDKAETLYNDIINDRDSDPAFRNLAVINIAILDSNRGSQEKSDIEQKLKELYDNNSEFAPLAGELYAFNLQKTGKHKEAIDILSTIAGNPLLTMSERMNAKALLGTMKEEK